MGALSLGLGSTTGLEGDVKRLLLRYAPEAALAAEGGAKSKAGEVLAQQG